MRTGAPAAEPLAAARLVFVTIGRYRYSDIPLYRARWSREHNERRACPLALAPLGPPLHHGNGWCAYSPHYHQAQPVQPRDTDWAATRWIEEARADAFELGALLERTAQRSSFLIVSAMALR